MTWRAFIGDAIGILGLVVFCAGVYRVAGIGFALVAAGLPFCSIWFWREVAMIRISMKPRKP